MGERRSRGTWSGQRTPFPTCAFPRSFTHYDFNASITPPLLQILERVLCPGTFKVRTAPRAAPRGRGATQHLGDIRIRRGHAEEIHHAPKHARGLGAELLVIQAQDAAPRVVRGELVRLDGAPRGARPLAARRAARRRRRLCRRRRGGASSPRRRSTNARAVRARAETNPARRSRRASRRWRKASATRSRQPDRPGGGDLLVERLESNGRASRRARRAHFGRLRAARARRRRRAARHGGDLAARGVGPSPYSDSACSESRPRTRARGR